MNLYLVPSAISPSQVGRHTGRAHVRPGDRREVIAIGDTARSALSERAADCNLPVSTMAGLLIEARIVLDWAEGLKLTVTAGPSGSPITALSAAEADYLRLLSTGRWRGQRHPDSTVAVPVRLLARAGLELVDRAVRLDPELAISLEVSALREGMLIGEWGPRRAIAIAQEESTVDLSGGFPEFVAP